MITDLSQKELQLEKALLDINLTCQLINKILKLVWFGQAYLIISIKDDMYHIKFKEIMSQLQK